jgi:hypothetical protein
MADDTTAALNHYGTTTELAFQRMVAGQIMGITELGYISGNWARLDHPAGPQRVQRRALLWRPHLRRRSTLTS